VVIAYWFGSKEHDNLDKLIELLSPLSMGRVYADGNAVYEEKFSLKVLAVSKKHTQKIESKHLSLRTWCSRLVRKGIRQVFSNWRRQLRCIKLPSDWLLTYWFFEYKHLIQ